MADLDLAPAATVRPSECRPAPLAATLRVALARSWRRVRSERGEADLPDVQLSILVRLVSTGPTTPGEIAAFHRIRPPSATRAVKHLEELGLVSREPHPTDKRQVVVRVTDAGREEVRETMRRRDAWLARQLATFSPEERELLARAAALLTRIAES
mgnify:CR=1 FL=1